MTQSPTIKDFINNRWNDSKEELRKPDQSFVGQFEARLHLSHEGVWLPSDTPEITPKRRRPRKWHDLLSTTMGIALDLTLVETNLLILNPKDNPKLDRRTEVFCFYAWLQNIYNLCEKVRLLVTQSCKLYPLDKNRVKSAFHKAIRVKVQDEVSKLRHPVLHGDSQASTLMKRVITQDKEAWEVNVALGPRIIDETFKSFYTHQSGRLFATLDSKTGYALSTLGSILFELEKEISKSKVSQL